MEETVVPLEKNLCGHPLAGLLWERQFEKVLLEHGWEKVPNRECLLVCVRGRCENGRKETGHQ